MKAHPEAKATVNDEPRSTSKGSANITPSVPTSAESKKPGKATERRGEGGHRVHFESVVEVGEAAGGGGFEAESVDVSPDGMRLRTASLPDVGDRLVCRFDGLGLEVVSEGEVIWRKQEACGGEFGLRFVDLDEEAAEAIRTMCGAADAEASGDAKQEILVPAGTRVRLHIEGLASPMKARVRNAGDKELEVGSNLEFLRIGRTLELEDVEKGEKREAMIDHVKVDLDPQTNVPQLVVSLRYEREAVANTDPDPVKAITTPKSRSLPRAPEADAGAPPTRKARPQVEEPTEDAAEEGAVGAKSSARAALETATRLGHGAIDKMGPMFASAGDKARGAMASLSAVLQKKRAERADAKKSSAPRRTTAPPPGGALKSEGRRLIRGEAAEEESAPPSTRMNKRAALFGSGLGLFVVLAVFAITRQFGGKPAQTASAAGRSSVPAALPPAEAAGAVPAANVPLFGATPLSTTEPVAPVASSSAMAATAPSAAPAIPTDDSPPTDKKIAKEWGQGTVTHPTVLRIKMDGAIDGIQGASGASGFTISVPNRRSVSSNTDLTRKDRRLASVKVINTSQGAEITVQFKDGVPPYIARVKGDKIEIALGDAGPKKVAKKKSKKKKHD